MEKIDNSKSSFAILSAIDCTEHIEKKNGLTYLSWAWAWQIAKKNFPEATYTIYENASGLNYHTDGRTCWVKTGVTIEGIEHIEYLPVMDFRNASIPVEKVTSFDVNKSIQRSLTKAIARHGLGLYIYAGEDIPDAADDEKRAITTEESAKVREAPSAAQNPVKSAETPVKRAVTMEHYTKGQCANLVAELAKYNHDNAAEWAAGKGAILYRKNADGVIVSELTIPADVMAKIETDAIKVRQQARLDNLCNDNAKEMISK